MLRWATAFLAAGLVAAPASVPAAFAASSTDTVAANVDVTNPTDLTAVYDNETDLAFRKGLQTRLAWTGDYLGPFSGSIDAATLRAIRDFQARYGRHADGIIDNAMLRKLIETSDEIRGRFDVGVVVDGRTGIRMAIPRGFVRSAGETEVGSVWRSSDRSVEVETVRIAGTGQTLRGLYQVLGRPSASRDVDNAEFGGDWFKVDGKMDGRLYSMRFAGRGDDLRGFSISYTPDRRKAFAPFLTVASNLFAPFASEPGSQMVSSNEQLTPKLSDILRRHSGDRSGTGRRYASASIDPANPNLFELPSDERSGDFADASRTGSTSGDQSFDMAGSGFAVSRDGWVLTNAHVVRACTSVYAGGKKVQDPIVFDRKNDLALLKISGEDVLPLPISKSVTRLGEDVLALGFPLRSILADSLNVTRGNVSSLLGLMNDPHYLQISAPVQPGNSGGPLVDLSGRVVGVVTAKLNAVAVADATGDIPQSINFAIRSDVVSKFLDAHHVRYVAATESAPAESVPDATASVKNSIMPILCMGQ